MCRNTASVWRNGSNPTVSVATDNEQQALYQQMYKRYKELAKKVDLDLFSHILHEARKRGAHTLQIEGYVCCCVVGSQLMLPTVFL